MNQALIYIDARNIRASGMGTYLQQLLPRIIDRQGHWKFRIFGDPAILSDFEFSRADNVKVESFTAPNYSVAEQLFWASSRWPEPDLFWWPHYTVPFLKKWRLVATVYDVAHLALPDVFNLKKRLYARFMLKMCRRRAEAIFFISQFSKDEFIRLIGRPSGSEYVTLLSFSKDWYRAPEFRRSKPITENPPYFVFVGNVKPHKNIKTLIRAYDLVRDKILHRLMIVGKRDGLITGDKEVFDLAKGSSDSIQFTGFIPQADLIDLVAGADGLILPSRYEGFGLPALEAMAAGCPTLVSTAASLPEVCGEASLYHDPDDINDLAEKLVQLASDEELRERLRKAGYENLKRFSWDRCADKTCQVFTQLVGK